jgi:hypothetical protein
MIAQRYGVKAVLPWIRAIYAVVSLKKCTIGA